MTLNELRKITDISERTNATYDIFDEDSRLTHSKASSVEFLTTVSYIEKHLSPGMKIADIGAGTGIYSLYFASKGYEVSAIELADRNCEVFRSKIKDGMSVDLIQGNALDLSVFGDSSFDIVLLFGPLYHLSSDGDRKKAISEAKRICKKDGLIFSAFISHDMIFYSEMNYDEHYFSSGDFDKETLRLNDFPFVFLTVDEMRSLLLDCGLEILSEVASDGGSELMAKQINLMTDEEFETYLRYHFYRAEKKELLGMSNHLLFITRNTK